MSLAHYQTLLESNQNQVSGAFMPELSEATLTTEAPLYIDKSQLNELLAAFQPESGWAMFTSSVELGVTDISEKHVLEGEWFKTGACLKILHQQGSRYQVTTMREIEDPNGYQLSTTRSLVPRNDAFIDGVKVKTVEYKLWWQQEKGENKGRWKPLAQQLIGFTMESKA